ncbi:MAG: patatin-like phospholipase family protein [Colwellia sp.]|nr:patatin-like phospholipase family protein [Colwellia sp.]
MDNYQKQYNETIAQNEFSWLKKRRKQANLNNIEQKDTCGIALSGGGIRSATFCLGALQALAKHKQLNRFDYLSTVSGGGYIASSLTWFKSRFAKQFPFGTDREDHSKVGGSVLSWLRAHSNFLTPGKGINNVSLLTAMLTGTLINLLIVIPVFLLLLFSLKLNIPLLPELLASSKNLSGFDFIEGSGWLLLILSFVFMLITALSTGFSPSNGSRLTEQLRSCVSALFSWGILLVIFGFIPWYHQYFEKFSQWLVHASISLSFVGIVISWLGARQSQNKSSSTLLTSLAISIGLILASVGVFVVCYDSLQQWQQIPWSFYPWLFLSVILALKCKINLVSMHGYYRNRLRDAFMPYKIPDNDHCQSLDIASWQAAQHCQLSKLVPTDMPYQLINCNIELWGSNQTKYRNRGCDSFTLSPLYCGSASTGYHNTKDYMHGSMDLATACAISGAAVATNTRLARSKALNFLMAILNLRLGCWLNNPNATPPKRPIFNKPIFNKPLWYIYMFRDMFGRGLSETHHYVHLSDGGHFENLGIYELVRRQCKLIFAFDAGADPQYLFKDLGRVTELVRVDFGAKLTIDVQPLVPDANKYSSTAWVKGEITYSDGSKAVLIYIKPCLLNGLSEDIYAYQRQNKSFPHQSTTDQFFDESQFEAYRELGFQISHRLLKTELNVMATACPHAK